MQSTNLLLEKFMKNHFGNCSSSIKFSTELEN